MTSDERPTSSTPSRALGLAIALLPSMAVAADVHVGPSATGNGDGSAWDSRAAWSQVAFARGNRYLLAAGSYGERTLDTPEAGDAQIVIAKATIEDHGNDAGWTDDLAGPAVFDGASLTLASGHWVIDGKTGGGPGQWRTGHGLQFTSPAGTNISYVSLADGVTGVTVRHAAFVQVGDTTASTAFGNAFYDAGTLDDATIEYCFVDNIGGLPFFFRGGTGNIIQYNYLGDICGASEADPDQHCEGIVIHAMSDLHFRWNYLAESPSSGGFVKNDVDVSTDVRIYGNTFADGFPINCNTGSCQGWRIFNNTFHHATGGPFGGDGDVSDLLYFDNVAFASSIGSGVAGTHGSNWFSQISANSCDTGANETENIQVQYPDQCDVVIESVDPFVQSSGVDPESFELTAELANWPGEDVCALDPCEGEKRYDEDALGRTRGADGVWERGAYEIGPLGGGTGDTGGSEGGSTGAGGTAADDTAGATTAASASGGGSSVGEATTAGDSSAGGSADQGSGGCGCRNHGAEPHRGLAAIALLVIAARGRRRRW